MINLRIEGAQELRGDLRALSYAMRAGLTDAMEKSVFRLQDQAKRNTPVDTGRLRSSIDVTVNWDREMLVGEVQPHTDYALYVHEGTDPHWPPVQALEGWARRHGMDAYVVALAIARRGTKAQPYLRQALETERDNVIVIFERAVRNVIPS